MYQLSERITFIFVQKCQPSAGWTLKQFHICITEAFLEVGRSLNVLEVPVDTHQKVRGCPDSRGVPVKTHQEVGGTPYERVLDAENVRQGVGGF